MVEEVLKQLHIEDVCGKLRQMEEYREKILKWNKSVNITSITSHRDFEVKHFVDSLLVAESQAFARSEKIIDVGTGGGFPGVPLAIAYPDKAFLLVDSLEKRLKIVRHICEELSVGNVTVCHGRAEDLSHRKEYRETFDLCVSRAVANLSALSEYCLPFVKVGGVFVAWKGEDPGGELREAEKAVHILGGEREEYGKPRLGETLPEYDLEHRLVYIRKRRKTPEKYPRKSGIPTKNPIK